MDSHNRTINLKNLAMLCANKQRDYLLCAYKAIMLLLDYTRHKIAGGGGDASDDLTFYKEQLADCATNLRNAYREGTPFVELSRCPISGEVLSRSLDTCGLDGLWWNNRNPIRPRERPSKTLFAFTGAMKLDEELEFTSFLVKPGPGVPFVIPKLLSHKDVQAVLSSVSVGRHVGFVIAYFADPFREDVQRANDWGREQYEIARGDGQIGWDKSDEIEDDYDFDLAQWIEQGKLHWISPGDSELNLRSGVKDCPYIGIEGIREIQRVKEGELWYPSLVDKPNAAKEEGRS